MSIHPLALVSPEAELGAGVVVAAFATIEAGVFLGTIALLEVAPSSKLGYRLARTMRLVNMQLLVGNHSILPAQKQSEKLSSVSTTFFEKVSRFIER